MAKRIAFAALGLAVGMTPALAFDITGTAGTVLDAQEITSFDEPWAMTYLPDGSMLVTEKSGGLQHVTPDGTKHAVSGIPEVAYGGQGGLGDVVIHPGFAENRFVYLSYAEAGDGGFGAVVVRGVLSEDGRSLSGLERIWEQTPKVPGRGHYSHRIAFDGNGHVFITSGDRQKLDPAQDFSGNLGKVIRLNDDGSVPDDNPWQDQGELAKTFWSAGHRNLLGIAFDADGRLWTTEMGPRHGDEINLTEPGTNQGWPIVSEGNHYSGETIPNHDTRPEFNPPEAFWVPSIAPSGLVIYSGDLFPDWQGDALIGGLVSEALINVDLDETTAKETERFEWGARVREVEQAPDDTVIVLEDGPGGRMLKLTPKG